MQIPPGGIYESVDLGLPSKTQWAKCNISATKESEYGDLFAWGATLPYRISGSESLDKTDSYRMCSASKIKGDLNGLNDVATALWGSGWKVPTKEQFDELVTNCTSEWTQVEGINGMKFISKINQQYVFFPAAGCVNGSTVHARGIEGRIWSSTLKDNDGSMQIIYNSTGYKIERYARYCGLSIRPVRV